MSFMGHYIELRLKGVKAKERSKTITDTDEPDFNETITIPVYKQETQDIPALVVRDMNADDDELLNKFSINFSKLTTTTTHMSFEEKWYGFEEDETKEIRIKLTFQSEEERARSASPGKDKKKSDKPKDKKSKKANKGDQNMPTNFEIEDIEDHGSQDKVATPKIVQFKFDDASLPDPKDTGKFADEFPSETSSVQNDAFESPKVEPKSKPSQKVKEEPPKKKEEPPKKKEEQPKKKEEVKTKPKESTPPKTKEEPKSKTKEPVAKARPKLQEKPKRKEKEYNENETPPKATTPRNVQFKFDDAGPPDPKNTGKFADENPSEASSVRGDIDLLSNDPPKAEQFALNDGGADVSMASGDFEN